jgi:hypothetical protein
MKSQLATTSLNDIALTAKPIFQSLANAQAPNWCALCTVGNLILKPANASPLKIAS